MNVAAGNAPKKRLTSLDVFRGITVAAMIVVNTPGNWDAVYAPLEHSKWNGCTPTDIVFPCFLFIMGISIVFSLDSKREITSGHNAILLKALRRMLLLIAFGLIIPLFYHFDLKHLRFPGVLQRIGVVYFISVLLFLKLSDRVLAWVFAIILVGYYLLLVYVPTPNGTGLLQPDANLAAFIDARIFSPAHLYRFAKTDPCGLTGTITSIASALSGVFVGRWIKQINGAADKIRRLLLAGGMAIIAGLLFALIFPINKALWTSSYVLYTSGICTLCMAGLYYWIDVKGHQRFTWIMIVFGSNALAAYILSEILPAILDLINIHIGDHAIKGMKLAYVLFTNYTQPSVASLLSAITFTALIWLCMLVLYKRKIILKI